MPTSMTKLQVWNLAIDIIKDEALQAEDANKTTARWLARNWDQTRQTTLRSYTWNFAKEYHSLSAEVTAPLHTWNRSFQLPPGWMRVIPPRRQGSRFGSPVPHEIVGNYIYTNESAPLKVSLIMDKENPAEWDPLFTEIVRCKLALGMANKFTSKNKFIELASQMLTAAQAQAEAIDTLEGSAEPVEQYDILRVRGEDYADYNGRGY